MRHTGTQTIATERLTLRRFTIEDAENMYYNWASDPEVTKYLTWQPHKSVEETTEILQQWEEDYSKNVYIARRGTKHVTDEATIKSTYKLIGNIPANDGADFWIGDIGVDTETCAWFVKAVGSSDRQGWGDRCYAGGKNTSGTREDLGRGDLGAGANGGPVCVYCRYWLAGASWYFLGCD